MAYIDFIAKIHKSTPRDYLERVLRHDKAQCAEVAKAFGKEYWDGERKYGYGGYRYDGRWRPVAADLIAHYGLKPGDRVLDIGCGKGYLLADLAESLPGLQVHGLDISRYAIEHAKEEVRGALACGTATALPFPDRHFDLVLSLNTLHYLHIDGFCAAVRELERVKRGGSYIVLESYRSEAEKANLIHWQLTCECFYTPEEWEWLFDRFGYTGDYSFIFFE